MHAPRLTSLLVAVALALLALGGHARPAHAAGPPTNMVVHLTITFANADAECTGFVIAPQRVATAGHCLYDPNLGWAQNVLVTPGVNGLQAPFSAVQATGIATTSAWSQSGDDRYDAGVVTLPAGGLGNATGWFDLRSESDTALTTGTFSTAGYPSTLPYGVRTAVTGKLTRVDGSFLYYDWNIAEGQSGSPIWEQTPTGYAAVGIVTQVVSSYATGRVITDVAVRIGSTVSTFLASHGVTPIAYTPSATPPTLFDVPDGRQVTIQASGTPATSVVLQQSTDDVRWSTIDEGNSNARGRASFTFTPRATAYYRSVFYGSDVGVPAIGKVAAASAATPSATATPSAGTASAAGAGQAPAAFDRAIAPSGVTPVVWSGGSANQLSAATAAAGGTSATAFVHGRVIVLIPGAPAYVNAAFDAAFPAGVPTGTIILITR